jgi:hypothetical protein
MTVKRRGIRLKQLTQEDPGIQQLLDSDLCLPEEGPDDLDAASEAGEPPLPHEVTLEVLQGLRETLAMLQRNVCAR